MFFFDNYQAIVIDVLIFVIIGMMGLVISTLRKILVVQKDQRRSLEDERKTIHSAVSNILRGQIIEYHEKVTERGFNSRLGLESFIAKYRDYNLLGNNGLVDQLYNEVLGLPVKGAVGVTGSLGGDKRETQDNK